MRHRDYRWLMVLGCNLLLLWLAGLANHYLSSYNVSLYIGGLLVAFPALRLDHRHSFTATLLTALAADAFNPVPFGTSLVLFGLVQATVLYGRQRFPREEPVFATVVALIANLFMYLVLSFILVGRNPHPAQAWLRLFADLLFSQLLIGLATPWFMALQVRLLELARIHPETGRPISAA
jgi:rod shape-determining protein MreD